MEKNIDIKAYIKIFFIFLSLLVLCTFICIAVIKSNINVEKLKMEQIILEKKYIINNAIASQLYKTKALAAIVIHGDGTVDNFHKVAAAMMDRDSAVANFLLAPNGIVSDIYPFEENKAAIGLNLLDILEQGGNREAIHAYEIDDLVMAGPFTLRQGYLGVSGRYPVFINTETEKDKFWGLVSVTLKFPQALEGTGLSMLEHQGLSYELWRINPDTGERQVIACSNKPSGSNVSFVERPVRIHNAEWYFRIAATRSWYWHPETFFIFFAGLCISLAGASLAHHNMKSAAIKLDLKNQTRTLNKMVATLVAKKDKTLDGIMTETFGFIAEIIDIDRVSVWRNSMKEDGVHASQIYRLDKSSGVTGPLNEFADISYAEYIPNWETIFTVNEVVNSPVRYLPEQEAAILQKFGMVSVFATPIFINDAFWGFVLFTDHKTERYFEENHVNFMRSTAFLFASAVVRDEMENEIEEANKFNSILIENTPIGINIFDEELNFIYHNDSILNMLGISRKKYHDFLREMSPEYQPDGTKSLIKAFEILKRTMKDEKQIFEWVYKSDAGELIPCEITTMLAKHKGKTIGISYIYDLRHIRNMERKVTQIELEMVDSKILIMLSQIQPHFLYNSLTAIRELCHIDIEKAIETVDEFSSYLRGNLDSLVIKEPILFERELQHVKTYLSIEKKRFGDRLRIIYDIEASNFLIPALTLQPIVENAVKHGVTKRVEGGTVLIKAEESETEAVITVIDDGIGFDLITSKKGERTYIGIENVKSRLAAMCSGTLSIQSKPGVGTTAIITIPKGGNPVLTGALPA